MRTPPTTISLGRPRAEWRYVFAALALSVLLAASPAKAAAAADSKASLAGHWKGSIASPGQAIAFEVDLREAAGGALSGDISIPVQNAFDLALGDVTATASRLRFRIAGVPGDPAFDGAIAADGARVEGSFKQGGADLSFQMERVQGAAATAKAALEGFDDFVTGAVQAWNVPGAGIAIVSGGEVVYAKGFGWRDLEARKPMTGDTLFAIGSTTKAMTATTLGMLVDEGKVEWDQPLRTYLPSFQLMDDSISQRITPRDIVTHRSGLPRHDLLWYNYNSGTRGDMVKRLAHLELTADLREKFQYNNLMFMTAGHLIETLTGKSWEETVRERLFAPLGMERSTFSVLDSQQDADFAQPYREREEDQQLERIPFRRIDLVGPAGSVNSSVNEMAKWLLFNLRRGKVGDRQLIQAATLEEIHSSQMPIPARPERADISPPSYGMGWVIDTYRGHRRLQHGGGIDGFITSVMLFPNDDLGVVTFTNSGSGLPSLLAQHAADRVIGLEPVDWSGDALAEVKKAREAAKAAGKNKEAARRQNTRPSHAIAEYPGEYAHPGYGTLRIEAGKGEDLAGGSGGWGLVAVINDIEAPLEHWHYDVWNGADAGEGDPTFEDRKFLFETDFEGNVAAVETILDDVAGPVTFERRPDARLSDPEYLARFAGTYRFAITGDTAVVEVTGNELTASVAGQPRYTLVPGIDGKFDLKNVQGIRIEFVQDPEGKVSKAIFYQPEGTFDAVKAP
jgi:CubicO group peptidase (beta-lactamase class C family)